MGLTQGETLYKHEKVQKSFQHYCQKSQKFANINSSPLLVKLQNKSYRHTVTGDRKTEDLPDNNIINILVL